MDLYVEKQCVDGMKSGDLRQFLTLFEANFEPFYKYVARRVSESNEVERIVRLTFLDALGQIQNTPSDVSYLTWLYSLAKPRVWDYVDRVSFPGKLGLISVSAEDENDEGRKQLMGKVDKMMKKLSLEEREILRLKFFEEVADGELITILGLEEGTVGAKIYRVLKRAHFLLFGESEDRQGVYFGELSGLFERIRRMESIEVPEVFKISLRADLNGRLDKKDFAIKGELVDEKSFSRRKKVVKEGASGSTDPAKIFVEAVKEMKEEEEAERIKQKVKIERREKFYDFVDKWKSVFALVPLVLFIWVVGVLIFNFGVFSFKVERGFPTTCEVEVSFEGEFSDSEKRGVTSGVADRICDRFEVYSLNLTRVEPDVLNVQVDVSGWFLEYRFIQKQPKDWRINKYARTPDSNQESGQV
jgi:RNA polymerase sigma-70 factor (ECF subfamily)